MRLIDADALGVGLCSRDVLPADYCAGWNGLIRLLEKAPTVDAVPVMHGRWMHEETEGGFHIWRCSRRGRGMNDNPEGIDLYCYHCGARMDGAEDE